MKVDPNWFTRAVDTISGHMWETSAHFYTTMPEAQATKLNNSLINQQIIPSWLANQVKSRAENIKTTDLSIKSQYSYLYQNSSDTPTSTLKRSSSSNSTASAPLAVTSSIELKHKIAGIQLATAYNNKLTDGEILITARKEKDIEFYKPVVSLKTLDDNNNVQWNLSWHRIIYQNEESLDTPAAFPTHSDFTTEQTVPGSGNKNINHAHDKLIDTLVSGGYEVGLVRVKIDKPKPFIKKITNKISPFKKTKETLELEMGEEAAGNLTPINTPLSMKDGNNALSELAAQIKKKTTPRLELTATTEAKGDLEVNLEEIGWKGTATVAKDKDGTDTETLEKINRLESGKPIFMEKRLGRIPALGRVVWNNKKWVVGSTILGLTIAIPAAVASNKSKEAELKEETIGGLEKKKEKLETDLQNSKRQTEEEKRKRQAAETDLQNTKNQQTENRRQDALNEGRRNGVSGSSNSTPSSSGGLTLADNRTSISTSQSNSINGAEASPSAEAKHLPGSLGSPQTKPTASSGKQPKQSASSLTQLLSQSAPWQRRAVV